MHPHKLRHLFILLALLWSTSSYGKYAPQIPQPSPKYSKVKFANFNALKKSVLGLISSSRERIVLISDFLTDGDISAALYLAKYRKVKVNVFLSKKNANRYLSRVRFLNQQGISVNYRSKTLKPYYPTTILIDSKLYNISRDLNVLKPDVPAILRQAPPGKMRTFVKSLIKSFKNQKNIRSIPLPLVGTPRRQKVAPKKVSKVRKARNYQGNADGSFNYDRAGHQSRPSNVPISLPKTTVHQKKQRDKIKGQ